MIDLVVALACGGLVVAFCAALHYFERADENRRLASCFTVDPAFKKRWGRKQKLPIPGDRVVRLRRSLNR